MAGKKGFAHLLMVCFTVVAIALGCSNSAPDTAEVKNDFPEGEDPTMSEETPPEAQ